MDDLIPINCLEDNALYRDVCCLILFRFSIFDFGFWILDYSLPASQRIAWTNDFP